MYNRAAMKSSLLPLLFALLTGLTGCTPFASEVTPTLVASEQPALITPPSLSVMDGSATVTMSVVASTPTNPSLALQPINPVATDIPQSTPLPSLAPGEWQTLPIIPEITSTVEKIYTRGIELGNDPNAFSKIGDCGSTPAWFLGDFDRGPRFYNLGEYTELEGVIQVFQGSFGRTSLAAKSGFNASSVFSLIWSDRTQCNANESPIACEYRVHRPTFAFVTLGSNDVYHQDTFEKQMRAIIEFSIEQGVVPILSTKADNLEGDGSINARIAELAREYDVPLWNYWLAVQPLPDRGLQEDQVHLTWGPNQFDNPQAMKSAWTNRNLTALQILDVVWRSATRPQTAYTQQP